MAKSALRASLTISIISYPTLARGIIVNYHMARTAPRALLLENYWENPRMRAVRISASRAGKSRTALLGTRTALCNAILGVFVAFKQMQTTYWVNFLCRFCFFILS